MCKKEATCAPGCGAERRSRIDAATCYESMSGSTGPSSESASSSSSRGARCLVNALPAPVAAAAAAASACGSGGAPALDLGLGRSLSRTSLLLVMSWSVWPSRADASSSKASAAVATRSSATSFDRATIVTCFGSRWRDPAGALRAFAPLCAVPGPCAALGSFGTNTSMNSPTSRHCVLMSVTAAAMDPIRLCSLSCWSRVVSSAAAVRGPRGWPRGRLAPAPPSERPAC